MKELVKDVINVVVIGEGLNYYQTVDWTANKTTINEKTYTIDRNRLFIFPRNSLRVFVDLFKRRRNVYTIVFKEGKPDAVTLPPLSRQDPSSDVLFIAERSDALHKAIEDLFRTTILSRKVLLFILLAVGVLAFAYLFATGQLPEISLPAL